MARALGHIDPDKANPARWKGHLDHLLPPAKKLGVRGHHAAMPYADLPAFMVRLAEIDTTASRALHFLILTCARTSEVLARDMGRGFVRRRDVARSSQPDENCQAARCAAQRRCVASFGRPNGRRGKNVGHFPRQAASAAQHDGNGMLLRRMGVGEFTVHGFRSAARSWMADTGVEFSLAEAALAHVAGNSVVQAYQRSSMLERRRPLMQGWANSVTGADADNVVPLKHRVRAPHRRA